MSEVKLGDWKPKERRYIVEWAEARYPQARKLFNVPIGPIPESIVEELGFERARRYYRRWRPYADCIVFLPEKSIVAEAEILNPKNAIGDLLYYRTLIPKTPDYPELLQKPVEYVLVIPYMLKWIKDFAEEQGIIVDLFEPEWIKDYLEQWHKYYTPEGFIQRELRKRRVERL